MPVDVLFLRSDALAFSVQRMDYPVPLRSSIIARNNRFGVGTHLVVLHAHNSLEILTTAGGTNLLIVLRRREHVRFCCNLVLLRDIPPIDRLHS